MGKKGSKSQGAKDDAPNPEAVPNRDILQRLNFLYQASFYLTELSASTSSQQFDQRVSSCTGKRKQKRASSIHEDLPVNQEQTAQVKNLDIQSASEPMQVDHEPLQRRRDHKRKSRKDVKSSSHISRAYLKSMRIIGQKTMVRLDPDVKRTICRGCNSLMLPGVTANVRSKARSPRIHNISYICKTCSSSRRFPIPIQKTSKLDTSEPANLTN
ncbi:Rpr2-domain-containing protein [Schizopora paradoxa]|uniref:Rpr2-domain-containing protein n=1 Tax=Schizopora paradoxa TaxID=27342 RepID=A0A0H2S396_9AGAM|nr:Rpr2-domain-containing protein [Schizopora paradoxa]